MAYRREIYQRILVGRGGDRLCDAFRGRLLGQGWSSAEEKQLLLLALLTLVQTRGHTVANSI